MEHHTTIATTTAAEPKGDRPPIPDLAVLAGILFVLMIGIPWDMLQKETGYCFPDFQSPS